MTPTVWLSWIITPYTYSEHQVNSLAFASTAVRKPISREQVTSGMAEKQNAFYVGFVELLTVHKFFGKRMQYRICI